MTKNIKKELQKVISINPNIRNGVPCFYGTRIPISLVLNQLAGGWSIDEILVDIPEVKKSQINKLVTFLPDSLKLLLLSDDKKINPWSYNC